MVVHQFVIEHYICQTKQLEKPPPLFRYPFVSIVVCFEIHRVDGIFQYFLERIIGYFEPGLVCNSLQFSFSRAIQEVLRGRSGLPWIVWDCLRLCLCVTFRIFLQLSLGLITYIFLRDFSEFLRNQQILFASIFGFNNDKLLTDHLTVWRQIDGRKLGNLSKLLRTFFLSFLLSLFFSLYFPLFFLLFLLTFGD